MPDERFVAVPRSEREPLLDATPTGPSDPTSRATVTAVSVDGAANSPSSPSQGPDIEVALDIEVAGALAPGVGIAVYFAPNTDQGFLHAITAALDDTTHDPSILSISWDSAAAGWDPCTGWGSPNGQALLRVLQTGGNPTQGR